MNTRNIDNAKYRLIKAGEHGKSMFVDITNDRGIEPVRNQHGNHDLLISTGYYIDSDPSEQRIETLRFHIACRDLEQARTSTLEVCYYINERFCIDPADIEIILTSVGDIADRAVADGNHADENSRQTGHIIGRDSSDLSRQDKDIGSHCSSEKGQDRQ